MNCLKEELMDCSEDLDTYQRVIMGLAISEQHTVTMSASLIIASTNATESTILTFEAVWKP